MKKEQFNQELLAFLDASPTPFHAVATMAEHLEAAGFRRLEESHEWSLKPGGRYYVIRNGSSIVAFSGIKTPMELTGVRLFGAHTDSPCLKLKPQPEIHRKGFYQLGVEVYGGALLNPWFDRDLSIAGRVTCQSSDGSICNLLVNWKRPVATIPSLAIHLDREVNSSRSINPQTQLPPVVMQVEDSQKKDFREQLLERVKAEHEGTDVVRVLDFELCLYDVQGASLVGMSDQFITSARLDNLLSCYTGLQALLNSNGEYPCILVCNDHEEVGSTSAEGASGPFLRSLLLRLTEEEGRLGQTLSRSLMFSADNAHGIHPNYMDKHDDNHGPILNQGPVIKINANQRYATNSVTSSFYRQLSEQLDLPYQVFVVRTDMACGSTIGPLTAAELGVKTLDIGAPQWAMHSIRELCGTEDAYHLFKVTQAFFNTEKLPVV
ncbi:M18 family aminopeptidase [Hahella sp. CCB-MM4]|uniref:M18 family aminopeptidase n=1 Tax=Hahella sp. (strain CCB-MM4) TaxID=1926491 RepID=UPI000B9B9955|nr:M18 family aminopeptidase [Hahella sp. CCB-MM4]OZG72082.1 M18 family aminopeptidase [Hahella sp. CCB-MM4]